MKKSLSLKFILIAALYGMAALLLFNRLEPLVLPDWRGYQEAARLSIFSRDFWGHWRANTIVLLIKLTGDQATLITQINLVLNLLAWLLLAGLVSTFLENARLRVIGFAAILFFSLGIDFFVWNRVLLTESLDNTLILLLISMFMLLHRRIKQGVAPPFLQQLLIGTSFALLIFLWGFSRPPNYFNALVLIPLIGLVGVVWWRQVRPWWPVFGILLGTLAGVYGLRNYLVDFGDVWQNGFMNNVAANILVDDEKTAFFVERGMPNSPEALHFRGYVPANRGGDWEAVFGEWIETEGRSAYIQYLVLTAPERVWESLQRWELVLNPDMLGGYLYGRNPYFSLSDWQQQNSYLLYSPGGVTFIVLGILALLLMLSAGWQKYLDWRWLVPLLLLISTLPIAVLNLNADAYEARAHTANSLKLRLAVLLLVIYGLDYWWTKRPKAQLQKTLVTGMVLLLGVEILLGYIFTRDKLVYPVVSAVFPETNMLAYRDVDDESYRVFQHVEYDARVLKLQTDVIDNEAYFRSFVMEWGISGIYGEFFHSGDSVAYIWRNTPQLISVAGPKGAVYGPIPLNESDQTAFLAWQERRLPGLLDAFDIEYVYIKNSAWASLPDYQQHLLENTHVYELVHEWDNQDRLYHAKGNQTTWLDFAGEQLGMSADMFATYQASEGLLPTDAVIFNPATGALADKNTILQETGAWIEATRLTDPLFSLLHVQEQMLFESDFSDSPLLSEWRATKQPEILQTVGIDYIAFSEAWFQWLTLEEQALFADPTLYEPIRVWQTEVPVPFYLYRVVAN